MTHCLLPVANLSSIGDFAALRQAIHNLGRFLYRTIFKSEEKAAILCDNLQVDQSQKSNAETAFIGRFFASTYKCKGGGTSYMDTFRQQDTADCSVESSIINQFFSTMAKTKEGKKIVEVRRHYRTLENGDKVLVREHGKAHRDSEELKEHEVALSKVYSCKVECLWYCVDTGLVTFSSQKPCSHSGFCFLSPGESIKSW